MILHGRLTYPKVSSFCPPTPKMSRPRRSRGGVGSSAADQAKPVALRRRSTAPTKPEPTIIMAQVAGSGTASETVTV